jgi:hypothetical protein
MDKVRTDALSKALYQAGKKLGKANARDVGQVNVILKALGGDLLAAAVELRSGPEESSLPSDAASVHK